MKSITINVTNHIYNIIDNLAQDFEQDIDNVITGMIQYANDKAFDEDNTDGQILLEGYIAGCSRFLKKEMGEDIYDDNNK